MIAASDRANWKVHARLDKYDRDLMTEVLGDHPELRAQARRLRRGGAIGFILPREKRIEQAQLAALGVDASSTVEVDGNLLCNPGIQRMEDLLMGTGAQAMNNTHCRIGTGDSTTAATSADTDLNGLSGSTHRWFNMADATYPSRSSQTITIVSTFGSSDGNYTAGWQEWGIDFGTSSGNTVTAPLLNHKVAALGSKVSGAVWAFTVTVAIS